jgi:hypothetical protein
MTFKTLFAAAALTLATAVPGAAMDAKLYPYHSKENYCPSGLQPVVMGGVVCCGQPNQSMTYAQVKQHPVAKRKVHRAATRSGRLVCPIGEKGCYRE